MVHPSKAKGNGYEREVVKQARSIGLPAKRAWGSDGRSIGEHPEVDVVMVDGYKMQLKRRKSLPLWLLLSPHVDAQVFRQDNGESYAMVPLWDLLQLLKQTHRGDDEKNNGGLG